MTWNTVSCEQTRPCSTGWDSRAIKSSSNCVKPFCPGPASVWNGCPYCEHADCAGEEDPCFGGYSVVSTSPYAGEDRSTAALFTSSKTLRKPGPRKNGLLRCLTTCMKVFLSPRRRARSWIAMTLSCDAGYSGKEEVLKLDVAQSLYVDMEDHKKFWVRSRARANVRNFEYRLRCKDGREITVIESSFASAIPTAKLNAIRVFCWM